MSYKGTGRMQLGLQMKEIPKPEEKKKTSLCGSVIYDVVYLWNNLLSDNKSVTIFNKKLK